METTVTGMFPNQAAASRAAARLVEAGLRADRIRVVGAATQDRHQFIAAKTSGAKRAAILGVAFGAVGGGIAGSLLASRLDFGLAALSGGLIAAFVGGLLGLAIGRTTKSQMRDEIEHQVDAGTVLVSVITDEAGQASAVQLLTTHGGSSVVSTAATFTSAALPPRS